MNDYPDSLDTRPLTTWPGVLTPDEQRARAPYSAPLGRTLEELARELRAVGARRPVLEVAVDPAQWRVDGRPYARAQAVHPGIVLSLPSTEAGALRFACDRYTTWQANLRAVVLTMEALRAVERHGAVQAREQYAGFKALPPGTATPTPAAPAMTVDEAARVLGDLGRPISNHPAWSLEQLLRSQESYASAWRIAVSRHHPDRGGDRATWDRLELAKRVLDEQAATMGSSS